MSMKVWVLFTPKKQRSEGSKSMDYLYSLFLLFVSIVCICVFLHVLMFGWPKIKLPKRQDKIKEKISKFVICPFCNRPVNVDETDKDSIERRCPYKECGGYLKTGLKRIKTK